VNHIIIIECVVCRLRLHFDGYGDSYDFWENADSKNIFPAGWCQRNGQRLTPPKGYHALQYTACSRSTGITTPLHYIVQPGLEVLMLPFLYITQYSLV
jgi:hypothetical protein